MLDAYQAQQMKTDVSSNAPVCTSQKLNIGAGRRGRKEGRKGENR